MEKTNNTMNQYEDKGTPLLEVKHLKKYYKINNKSTLHAVDDVSFRGRARRDSRARRRERMREKYHRKRDDAASEPDGRAGSSGGKKYI